MPGTQEFTLLGYSFVQVTIGQGWRRLPNLKSTPKESKGFGPYQNKPFCGPPTIRKETPKGNAPMRATPLKAVTNQSTNRKSPLFFQRRLANKQMFKQHYHQWLYSTIHLQAKLSESSPDSLRI